MKFFHVYNEDCYKGLEKNGLLNKDTGFKIQNVFSVPKERQFNNIAARGGKLHTMIKEGKIPFYVDRIAGGITYFKYEYDKNLIHEYESILGDWFLGFQLHESASNRKNDWARLIEHGEGKGPYDVDLLDKVLKSSNVVTPDGEYLHSLAQGSIYEYAKLRFAETYEEFYEEIREMFKLRMAETEGHILPCDSYFLMTKLQDELGMKTFMPEVGAQIPDTRQALALARGVARASNKTWGAYYECWMPLLDANGKVLYTMPCFHVDEINEWYLTQETHTDDFTTYGENGGSSRLLQNRLYFYALMSGADYFSEEWGLNCSYYDMQDFTLSPYGETKKAFINDALGLQGIKAQTPFALVIPKEFEALGIGSEHDRDGNYIFLKCPLSPEQERIAKHMNEVRRLLFGAEENCGNEGHIITNSRFGDVFDIIHADTSPDELKKYEYLIDASPDGDFAKKSPNLRVLESGDIAKLESELQKLIRETMPVYVDGLCWLVSTDENGRRYLSIFNNSGNDRSLEHGNTIDHAFDRAVSVSFKEPSEIKVVKEGNFPSEISRKDEKTYTVKVPATAFVILEF